MADHRMIGLSERTSEKIRKSRERATERNLEESEARTLASEERAALSEKRTEEAQTQLAQVEEVVHEPSSPWVVRASEIQQIGLELGRGGYYWESTIVSVATFRGTLVAAKTIRHQILSERSMQTFKQEMNMAAGICHPNIAQFIGATLEGETMILTELMHTSLRKEVGRGFIPPSQATSIGLDVARALNYLHLLQPVPLIHCNISSTNVLLESLRHGKWKAKVTDYVSGDILRQLYSSNAGTRTYASPEAHTSKLKCPKMDIYSFGVLVLEILTGELPVSDERERLLSSVQHQQLLGLIQRCLSETTEDRPSAAAIIAELNPK